MPVPAVGDIAPDFTLMSDAGTTFALSRHRFHPVVIYFYPQDMTEGCTIENQEFTALLPEFDALGVTVVGVSPDTVESHCTFRDRYGLKAPLLADPDHAVIDRYGFWTLKKNYGREYLGVVRASVLVGADGRVAAVVPAPRIKGHAAKVLAQVRILLGAQGA